MFVINGRQFLETVLLLSSNLFRALLFFFGWKKSLVTEIGLFCFHDCTCKRLFKKHVVFVNFVTFTEFYFLVLKERKECLLNYFHLGLVFLVVSMLFRLCYFYTVFSASLPNSSSFNKCFVDVFI